MTGGTLVQAVETSKALAKYLPETRFELFNWSEASAPADCYHFIGLPKYLAGICSLVTRVQRPYVLTLLMGAAKPVNLSIVAWQRRVAGWLRWNREHQQAIENAAALIALTEKEAGEIAVVYRVPRRRIHVVPVAVSEFYFEAKPDLWRRQYGSEPFVLCVGAIQERKNQLLLASTCNALRLPLVLVGGVLPGQERYADQIRAAMTENQALGGRWLRCDDPLLASAYAACRVVSQLSVSESQPASVLQALALQKPVLLGQAPYARQYPFDALPCADWRDSMAVKDALQRLWNQAPPTTLPEKFTWPNVCKTLGGIYSTVLQKQ